MPGRWQMLKPHGYFRLPAPVPWGKSNLFTFGREVLFPSFSPLPYSWAPRSPVQPAQALLGTRDTGGRSGRCRGPPGDTGQHSRLPSAQGARFHLTRRRPRPRAVTFRPRPLPPGLASPVPSSFQAPPLPVPHQALTRLAGLPWYCGLSKHHRFS